MPMCQICSAQPAVIRRQFSQQLQCKSCFILQFEEEVHYYIQKHNLIQPNQTVVVGVSGGKDSSVLLTVLFVLFTRYPEIYKNKLAMCAVDEGIAGYRSGSLDVVHELQKQFGLPLTVVSFQQRFKRTLDQIVEETTKNGKCPACSFCGVLRRNSLNYGAQQYENSVMATGHNADDQAETVLLNIIRGDYERLARCVDPVADLGVGQAKIKPLAGQCQKEVVLYAHHAAVRYFSTECPYAVGAQRGVARRYIGKMVSTNKQIQLLTQSSIQQIKRGEFDVGRIKECGECGAPLIGVRCQTCQIRAATQGDELLKVLKGAGGDE